MHGQAKDSNPFSASVSTDLMDSFIDEMNSKPKRKSRSQRSQRNSVASSIQSSRSSHPRADEPTTSSGRNRRTRIHSDSASSDEMQETPGLPWQRRMMMAPKVSRDPLRQRSTDTTEPRSEELTGEPSFAELRTIAAELRGPAFKVLTPEKVSKSELSIDDIIRKHASASPKAFGLKNSAASPGGTYVPQNTHSASQSSIALRQSSANVRHSLIDESTGSAGYLSHLPLERLECVTEDQLTSSGTYNRRRRSSTLVPIPGRTESSRSRNRPEQNSEKPNRLRTSSIMSKDMERRSAEEDSESIAAYLKSHRLTRLIDLRHPCVIGQQVSMADVGDPQGYPVVVFLGLGSVRYLVALFDEIAAAHNIRLICIDRWGLGRSTDVPSSNRGMREWAVVVEDVMDQIGVKTFGILAHSAGTPYALATALHMPQRVSGKIHLLAPWANVDAVGGEWRV